MKYFITGKCKRLTLWGFGVVLPEGFVFRDVGVEEAERVLWDVLGRHHLVGADDVGQRDGGQLLLRVRLHGVEERLVWVHKDGRFITIDRLRVVCHYLCVCSVVHISPWTSCSIQVKVMAPSRLLSLNLSRKVPGHLLLSRAFSLSLLMKPMMELQTENTHTQTSSLLHLEVVVTAALTRRSRGKAGVFWSDPGFLRSTTRRQKLSRWHSAAGQKKKVFNFTF